MSPNEFIKAFNSGDVKARATLYRRQNLKEADVNLMVPLPPNEKVTAVVFAGYLKVRAAVWYIITAEEKRLPGKAFRMRPSGKETFDEFAATSGNRKFAEQFKEHVIKAFDGAVLPDEWGN